MAAVAWTTVALGILSVWRSTTGFRDPATTSTDIPVFLGPEHLLTDDPLTAFVVVGYSVDPDTEAGALTQTVGPMAGPSRPRDEPGTVECRLFVQSGNTDVVAVLQAADTAVGALATAIRSDQTLGVLLGARIPQVGVLAAAPDLYANSQGVACEWALTISYTARV